MVLNQLFLKIFQMETQKHCSAKPTHSRVPEKNELTISFIIPTFNRKEKIQKSIESIIGQPKLCAIEIIIVDDGNDGTDQAVRKFLDAKPNIKIIYLKPTTRLGLSKSRNTGLKSAVGDYLVLLDSDNRLKGNILGKMLEVFQRHSDLDLVFFRSEFVSGRDRIKSDKLEDGFLDLKKYLLSFPVDENIPVISKRLISNKNLFEESLWGFEGIAWLRLLKGNKKCYLSNTEIQIYDDLGNDRLCTIRPEQAANRVYGIKMLLDEFGEDFKKWAPRYYQRQTQNLLFYYSIARLPSNDLKESVLLYQEWCPKFVSKLVLSVPHSILLAALPVLKWMRFRQFHR